MKRARPVLLILAIATNALLPIPARADGALASARQGRSTWGSVVTNRPTRQDAEQEALRRCSLRGSGCAVRTTFVGSCIAVVVQAGTGNSGWAVRPTIADAQNAALNICRAYGGQCELKTSACDHGRVEPVPQPRPVPSPASPPSTQPAPAPRPSVPASRPRGCDLYPELCP